MASKVAPPKNTGGGGFVFEDDVCAWLLASMLVGERIFGTKCGALVRVDFQTRPDGWFIDDVLVTTALGERRHRFALSLKSNAQFTAKAAPSDFVKDAWEQWFQVGSAAFDAASDFMVLVTAPLSGAAANSIRGLSEKSQVNDPSLFPARLATPNWSSDNERSLFASFSCPAALGRATTYEDTARLLQRLRFLSRDFGILPSDSENTALELCRRAVRSHTAVDAQDLWNILRKIASALRPQAGSLTLIDLINQLRAQVLLAEYPDHAEDWTTLDSRSAREVKLVRDSIANRIHLSREGQVNAVIESLTNHDRVVLLGPSGMGKSALAKAAFERRRENGQTTLWVDVSAFDGIADFGAFEITLQLRHPLAELLVTNTDRDPLVIIDGLDRIFSEHAFRTVATLLQVLDGEQPAVSWRVLIVCQSQEWSRVHEKLQSVGAPFVRWSIQKAEAPQPADLQPVRDAVPALGRLFILPRVGELLMNLKLLDLVVRRLDGGTKIDASTWVGESSVAEWFWDAEIERGSDRLVRGQYMRALAQTQADQLVASISEDNIEARWLSAAQTLIADQLLERAPGDRLTFAHDLYGDWVRVRILLNHRTDLVGFLKDRHESPLWHRAIRLLGIHVLEHANGVDEWKTLMSSFSSSNLAIVRDLLLEAPAFATNAGMLLNSIFPDLVSGSGVLLRRLLTRFLAFATTPDEHMLEFARNVGMDLNEARVACRRPQWLYWLDVLAVLHTHRTDAINVAPTEIARIVEMWLQFVPLGSVRRREVAELAVILGQKALNTRDIYDGREVRQDRERFYRCALLAAPEKPDEVAALAKTAAERVPRPVSENTDALSRSRPHSIFASGVIRGPWPDGPLDRVDGAFANVVLNSGTIRHLYRVRPAVAREVILATLIEAPFEEDRQANWIRDQELGLAHRHNWHPPSHNQGPFLLCLLEDFDEGIELIMRLVEFVTERSNEYATRELNNRRARAVAEGWSDIEIEEIVKSFSPQHLMLHDGTMELRFIGDARSYGWSSGLGNSPDVIVAALMALEQCFYYRLDAGEDISEPISTVLARSRSVAPLGVLCDIGKRQPILFRGPLRALLSSPELYAWEIDKIVQGREHLLIGAVNQGRYFFELAQQFHGLEHRKRDLRTIAIELLLNCEEVQTLLATVRNWWKQRHAEGESFYEMVDQLNLLLDLSNYERRQDSTHGTVIVNVAIEQIQTEGASEHQKMNDRVLFISFPVRCRKILDERQLQNDEQLEELWRLWLRIHELSETGPALPDGEEPFDDGYANAITGGIAVFQWHKEWLDRHDERRFLIDTAIDTIASSPPGRSGFAGKHDVSTCTWECFLAEAAAFAWVHAREDKRWRRFVAGTVFAEKYVAVRMLFSRCSEHRVELGDDFERLRRLVVDWAYIRDRADMLRGWQHLIPHSDEHVRERLRGDITTWTAQAVTSFVEGTLEPLPVDWKQFSEASRFAELDALRRRGPDSRIMDFHLVRCSHEWLPLLDETLSQEERESTIQFWRVALDVVTSRPRADLRRRDHPYPHEDEAWVLEKVAAVVLQLRPEEAPELFYQVIIDLHSEAHDWPERFFSVLHRLALSSEHTPTTYGPLVREIAKHAFTDVDDAMRWPWYEKVWDAVIGIDGWARDQWTEYHVDHVDSIWDVISLWMDKVPQDGRRLARFARWLSTPSANTIRLRTLPWFLERLRANKEHSIDREDDTGNGIAKLLNVVWDLDQSRLRTAPEQLSAFRGLLAWLVERQNTIGLELQGRIGGLT